MRRKVWKAENDVPVHGATPKDAKQEEKPGGEGEGNAPIGARGGFGGEGGGEG